MKSITLFFCLFSLVVVIAKAQVTPNIPNLPQQFTADVVVSTSLTSLSLKGELSYDYPNQKQRFDSSLFGVPQTEIDIFENSTRFVFEPNSNNPKHCQRCTLTSSIFPLFVLDLSTYVGQTQLNGEYVDVWTLVHPVFDLVMTWWVSDTYSSDPVLVQANFTVGDLSTWIEFSNQVPVAPPPSVFQPPSGCGVLVCDAPANIVFLVDGSGSILYSDFSTVKNFLLSVVQSFQLSTTAANVGVIEFSDYPSTVASLSSEEADVLASIQAMTQTNGNTDLSAAITSGAAMLQGSSRTGVPDLLVILTDGYSSPDPTYAANAAKSAGIEIYTVAIGSYDLYVLESICSAPTEDHFFNAAGFDQLTTLLDSVVANTCSTYSCNSVTPKAISSGFRGLWNQLLEKENQK